MSDSKITEVEKCFNTVVQCKNKATNPKKKDLCQQNFITCVSPYNLLLKYALNKDK